MHYVSESATSRSGRRQETSYRISRCAQQLTEERGLDGFTMEDLAEAAEVSRRTLFNYFPGKIDAVLGGPPELSAVALAEFHSRGAGSNLVDDLRDLAAELMDTQQLSREDVSRSCRLLVATPRLLAASHERFREVSAQIVEEIRVREGAAFDAHRAQIAVRLLAALFDAALDSFLTDPDERPLAEAYDEVLRAARQLLA
jgi:AcrR family transcriptional regulator